MHSSNGIKNNTKLFNLAVISGNKHAVNHFIELGEDVNSIDRHSITPLIHAVIAGHADICEILLKAGADPFYKDNNGDSAISLTKKIENMHLNSLMNNFSDIKKKSSIEKSDLFFDFDNDTEEKWTAEKVITAPKSDMELVEKLQSNHQELSAYITVDSDESFDDIDIDFPDIFIKKKLKKAKIKEPLYKQLQEILTFGYLNGVFHKSEYETEIAKQKLLKYRDLRESLEATFSASGIDIIDSEILAHFYTKSLELDLSSDFLVDEMIEFMELELDGYRNPLMIFLNEAARYPLLTDDQVRIYCNNIKVAHSELISAISSEPSAFEQILNEIDRCLQHDSAKEDAVVPETHTEDIDGLTVNNEIYSVSQLSEKKLQEKIHFIKEQNLNITETRIKSLTDLVLDWNFLINTSRTIFIHNDEIFQAMRNAINKYLNAKTLMVNSNLRLVYSIAKKYSMSGIPTLDLIQEGSTGLMKAVDRFDFDMGNKFSTYATWWIRQTITRCISNDKEIIRIPVHMHESINKLKQAEEYLNHYPNNTVTESEIAEFLQWPINRVNTVKHAKKMIIPISKLIDSEFSEVWEYCAVDKVDEHDPEYLCHLRELRDLEFKIMEILKEREKDVLLYRSGFHKGQTLTLEALGEMYDVTRERIRQIEAKGLKKMRNPKYLKQLKAFYPASPDEIKKLEKILEPDSKSVKKNKKTKTNLEKTNHSVGESQNSS